MKNSYGICDVCVKNSREICELIFPLGQRCRKEMVRACSFSEIFRRWQLSKDLKHVPSDRSDLTRNKPHNKSDYEGKKKKKLGLNFRSI